MQAVNWAWFEIPILIGHGQGRLVSHITCNGSMQVIQSDVLKTLRILDLYYLIRVDNYTCDIGPNVFAKNGEKIILFGQFSHYFIYSTVLALSHLVSHNAF